MCIHNVKAMVKESFSGRKVFPGVINGSNNLPEKRIKMMLIKKKIYKLNINLFIEFVMCPLQNIMIFRQN